MRLRWFGLLLIAAACGGETRATSETGGGSGLGGSSAGTGGQSAGGAATGGLDAGPAVLCPEGLPGPTLAGIPAPNGPYCIDSTEVTVEQYQAFVASQPSLAGQPASCAFNISVGEPGDPDPKTARKPMLVNWCNAWLYCAWAGKRLCGRIVDGGPVDYDVGYDDPEQSEWFFACSGGGTRLYPYGNEYDPKRCNGADNSYHGSWPVGFETLKGKCEGGFDGLFDMSGNVQEWENSCARWLNDDDACRDRSPPGLQDAMRCNAKSNGARGWGSAGIRCCVSAAWEDGG